jgi:hypothetical protein
MQTTHKDHKALIAPIGIGGLFGNDDEEDEGDNSSNNQFEMQFEVQSVPVAGKIYAIRQFSFHCANANQIWPGAMRLGEYLVQLQRDKRDKFQPGDLLLELGAATGALAMCLVDHGLQLITSDYDDDDDIIADNLKHNFEANGLVPPCHVPFTWGTGWAAAVKRYDDQHHSNNTDNNTDTDRSRAVVGIKDCRIRYIVASDILLYVSVYPALVASLEEIFQLHRVEEFIMSWNRRIAESSIFFDLMKAAGFNCVHLGSCIYSFTR